MADFGPPKPFDRAEVEAVLRATTKGVAGIAQADVLAARLESMVSALTDRGNAEPDLPLTEAAIRASVAHTFTLEDPAATTDEGARAAPFDHVVPATVDERRALLAHSTTVLIGGSRRLMLSNAARARVIEGTRSTSVFREILSRCEEEDAKDFDNISNDPIRLPSAWLRCFLTGEHGKLEQAPAREVNAAVDALECLQGVKIRGPSLETARRLRDLAELLEPLRLLIGQRGGWEGEPLVDRFVGREDELATLRGFVDELDSHSAAEAITRFVGRTARRAHAMIGGRDESVCFIVARGGMGKSSLVAKFMLDHAMSPARPIPFAYIDFDRASIRAREPLALLSEVARQVSLQDAAWNDALAGFRADLRDSMAGVARERPEPFATFRQIVRARITPDHRAFLIVLDTMEVVQYDPLSIDGIVAFQTRLADDTKDPFPNLRIVASGRADVPELRTGRKERSGSRRMVLKPFSVTDAKAMAGKLGVLLMRESWREGWAKDIAGRSSDPPERREPLTLRVAVELMRDTAPEARAKLASEIATSGEQANEYFVGRLYERRILSHIRDADVRRLAWPGLVFRRVTDALIRDVLAGLCGIDPARAGALFEALASEVWMVERAGSGVVRHRPDLRARTLPLMRRRAAASGSASFDDVNRAAVRYYAERRDEPAARAEWLYHRLLAGEDCASVDADWTHDMPDYLRGAADDFERDTEHRNYLLSRTATRLLAQATLTSLPTRLALDHIARTGQQLARLDDVRAQPIIVELSSRLAREDARTSEAHPVRAVLLAKTGQWDLSASFDGGQNEWQEHAQFAARFVRARTMGRAVLTGKMADGGDLEALPLKACIQDLALARITGSPRWTGIDRLVAIMVEKATPSESPSDLAALRTAVVFGRTCSRPAARLWLAGHRFGVWTKANASLSLVELAALIPSLRAPSLLQEPRELAEPLAQMFELASSKLQSPTSFSHDAVGKLLVAALESLLADPSGAAGRRLREYFAARDEDWIVPMGYAAAGMSLGKLNLGESPPLADRLESYEIRKERFGFRRAPIANDPLQILRRADEASDFRGAAVSILEHLAGGSSSASDMSKLLQWHATWRTSVDRILEDD